MEISYLEDTQQFLYTMVKGMILYDEFLPSSSNFISFVIIREIIRNFITEIVKGIPDNKVLAIPESKQLFHSFEILV